ncbi:MAG: saccharopine dehydrogenase NADP-binding domain-containing protein [Oceanicaulis sp.]
MSRREFDIVVFGATGFTGRLVAEFLAAHHPEIRFAMAGRNPEKLKSVRDEIGAPADTPLIEAGADDHQALLSLTGRAECVITTVGPYQLYGEPLLRACALNGTDYVDLCGEPAWMADMIKAYEAQARESGARIVLSCGFDSIPFDLGVMFLQEEAIRRSGAPIERVKGRVRSMKGTFSGGTAASFAETMKRAQSEPEVIEVLKNPFALTPGFTGPQQPHGAKPVYEDDLGSWSAPFIMAAINTKNVHRTNFLLGHRYGEAMVYDEMLLTGPGEKGEQIANHVAKDRSMAENKLKPGEGPSKEEREKGSYELMFTGETKDGERITAIVSGDRDPGYGSTSKMIAETAIGLAKDIGREHTPGGIWTPGSALGKALIDRLSVHAGLSFRYE